MVKERDVGSKKVLLGIPVLILVLGVALLVVNFSQTGEWFQRSIELKGGTLVTLTTDSPVDSQGIEDALSAEFGKVIVREYRSYSGQGLTIQADSGVDAEMLMENLEELGLDTSGASVETVGPSLGESFWAQAQLSLIIAFILMGIIVFVIFRTLVPSLAVIAAAVSDMVVTLAAMQVLGLELSMASFAALLMLIGYSIDTDILLTTRIIRTSDGTLAERTWGAFKTGMTMTLTTLAVLGAVLVTTTSGVLFAIASVLFIGLIIDIINTWLMNAVIIRWYAERKGL